MATGPCGVEFRDAFSCFHYSESEPKGSDCYDTFSTMQVNIKYFRILLIISFFNDLILSRQECMAQYPAVYNQNTGDDDKEGGMGMDLGGLDDGKDQASTSGDKYADGELESKLQQGEVAKK